MSTRYVLRNNVWQVVSEHVFRERVVLSHFSFASTSASRSATRRRDRCWHRATHEKPRDFGQFFPAPADRMQRRQIRDEAEDLIVTRTVAGRSFTFSAAEIERVMANALPDPVREHYVVVAGRRFPPKQVVATVTGLDRADFTTHQARRVLQRTGFAVGRQTRADQRRAESPRPGWPHGGREADLLRPYRGRWVAQRGLEVMVAADDPREVVRWLHRHDVRDAHVYRVPTSPAETDLIGPR